jgi:hypothetical protein
MNGPPKRIIEDPGMPRELRDGLLRAQRAPVLRYDTAAGLARFQASIVAGAPPPTAPHGLAGATGAVSKTGLFWGIAAVGTAGVVAAVLHGSILDGGAPTEVGDGAASASPSNGPPAETRRVDPRAVAPSSEESAGPRSIETEEHPAGVAEERRAPVARPDADAMLRREIAQLAEARRQLGTSPDRALALALRGQREFPRGMLGEERDAIVIFALDRLGRQAEALERAEAYVERHPRGPFTSPVRAIAERDRAR